MESYTFTPSDNFGFGNQEAVGKIVEISYGEAMMTNFCVREVFINGKPKGEYHVRVRDPNPGRIHDALIFFIQTLGKCEVGVIDPSNMLNLDYQIFVKTSDPMSIISMMDVMSNVDKEMTHK